MVEIRSHDMYGQEIVPLGETGYGVSVCFASYPGRPDPYLWPQFTVFHVSDGFRQSLFSVNLDEVDRPSLCNIFQNRVAELMATHPHGRS